MWRTCTEMRSADQISDDNQDQMTIELFALNVLSNKSLKLNVDQKVLGRELLLHLAEHLCTSYLAGDKVFAQIHISLIVPKVHISLPIYTSVQGPDCLG